MTVCGNFDGALVIGKILVCKGLPIIRALEVLIVSRAPLIENGSLLCRFPTDNDAEADAAPVAIWFQC